jgi:hypothetical protein
MPSVTNNTYPIIFGDFKGYTIADRVAHCAAIVNASREPFLCWCNLNDESSALLAAMTILFLSFLG